MKRIIYFLLALSLYGFLTSCSDSISGNSIIDEPENTKASIDISDPRAWSLASVPTDLALFPEASLSNDVASGENRALLSWYIIDRLFTQRNSSKAPDYIKNDPDALSYPYAREVLFNEIYPGRELNYGESSVIETFNLSFYPRERGPYNLDGTNVDEDGYLLHPEKRWGGIMRKMVNPDLEQAGIEYIQFWLLDPFMDDNLCNRDGGYLYFNLGEVSEDVLKDGYLSYENGLPVDGGTQHVTATVWGKVPSQAPLFYAFGNNPNETFKQDVGLDGLSNQEEFTHPSYANYLNALSAALPSSTIAAMRDDPFSPFNDPAGDDYSFYRSYYYDANRYSINGRYKYYNGTDGNTLSKSVDQQYMPERSIPDTEDTYLDYTLNEQERFFQYRVAIHPDSLQVGKNYITAKQVANVHTRNGEIQAATWYQFTIPLCDYQKKVGSIQDFSNIRFIRMYMTGFRGTTHLRFATLELVGAE